jgi:hypothetical protein
MNPVPDVGEKLRLGVPVGHYALSPYFSLK